MSMEKALHQMFASAERCVAGDGEAIVKARSDEASPTRHGTVGAGPSLLTQVMGRENMQRAWKRVKANKGAAGVDGLDIAATGCYLVTALPTIRDQVMAGTYRQQYVQQGYRVAVDVDLEKFFDRVNHDVLIDRLQKRIKDAGIIRLIRAFLNAGIMHNGVVVEREPGTPQGGPLSPLLAKVLLDEVDRELERRGRRFARYADDCNIYVCSRKAGGRVIGLLKRLYDKLRLTINASKSTVASAFGRKFLGYSLWVAPKGEVKCAVSQRALETFKQRVRELTRRTYGRSMTDLVESLRSYMLGWKAYFGLAQTPGVWRRLDEWLRHRLRAIQLKHWKRGTTMYRELLSLGASAKVASLVAQ